MDIYTAETDSPRVTITKSQIKTALRQLLKQKPITKIRIHEITELAQINRTTFYRYYLDIYDLYYQVLDDYIVIFQEQLTILLQKIIQHKKISAEDLPLDFFKENQEIIKFILQDPTILIKIKAENKKFMKQLFSIPEEDQTIDYILEHLISGQLGFFSFWIQNGMTPPMEDLFPLMKEILFSGAITTMLDQIK